MGLVSRVWRRRRRSTRADVAGSMARFSPYGLAMTKDVLWANLEVSNLEPLELEDRNQLKLGFREPARAQPWTPTRRTTTRMARGTLVPGVPPPLPLEDANPPSLSGSRSASASVTRLRAVIASRSPMAARLRHDPTATATSSSMPDAQPVGLAASGRGGVGELVDRHLAGDVLALEASSGVHRRWRPVGAHPLEPGPGR